MDYEAEESLKGDERVIAEIKRRFKQCQDWESKQRKLFLEDIKFANADADNGYQWPNDIYTNRNGDNRPCLTINKVRQHNLQIVNDAKQNKPSIKFRPVGDGATYDAAQIFEGLARHTEYISNATSIYDSATRSQVEGGIGYWRVVTEYADKDTFDQEIYIRRIKDPLSVYLDPDINELDGSDAMFGFVYEDIKKEVFKDKYPEFKDLPSSNSFDNDSTVDDKHIRVCEYYRRNPIEKELISYKKDPTDLDSESETVLVYKGNIPSEIVKELKSQHGTKTRKVIDYEVEWFKVAGDKIIENTKWLGKYIPIVRLIGEETIINGILDRKGHTRALKDPQRMYNYFSSASVEQVALQTKVPWLASVQSIEGHEAVWRTANIDNPSMLPYNAVNDDGTPIPPPERINPPVSSQGYLQSMETAKQELMLVSGQYEATMGQRSNEVSGKAIDGRQRQGENATYHFIDNNAIAIKFTAKILYDLYPKIYDTNRVLKIIGEDGSETDIMLDPQATQAHQEVQKRNEQKASIIFNPNVGKYDIYCDIGPAYATRRQEAWNAITQIIKTDGALVPIVGDLLFRSADFPNADKIAERLERMVPPQAKGIGPSPQEQQLQQQAQKDQAQIKHLSTLLENYIRDLADAKSKIKSKDEMRDIDVFDAYTKRIAALEKHIVTPKDNARMLHDIMSDTHTANLQMITDANSQTINGEQNGTNGTQGDSNSGV